MSPDDGPVAPGMDESLWPDIIHQLLYWCAEALHWQRTHDGNSVLRSWHSDLEWELALDEVYKRFKELLAGDEPDEEDGTLMKIIEQWRDENENHEKKNADDMQAA